jgi:hypothetical protein
MQRGTAVNERSEDLHQVVLREIEVLLKRLGHESVDLEVTKVLRQVQQFVSPVHDELKTRIESLRDHARWDKFTIAFYGETNAGKSTTIETLRILLGEQTKREAHARFHSLQKEFGLGDAALAALRQEIGRAQAHVATSQTQADENVARRDAARKACERDVLALREQIDQKKRSASWWQKVMHLLRKLPEEALLAQAIQKAADVESKQAEEQAADEHELTNARESLQDLLGQQADALAGLDELAPFADGYIVGTGRSDFTRDTAQYTFETDGQLFELLDVPGIEGKETDVINSILGAVQAAHAVFYVTGKAAPPQTGDEDGQGTLEKIRAHLGDHTEVWAIYNKRITNPIPLEKAELVSDGERGGIHALDETMRGTLGDKYRGCIALSAQPAFLAASECLVPDSDLVRNRNKFLAKFGVEEVIAKSGFRHFVDMLTGSMVADSEARIRAANLNKVHCAVKDAEVALRSAQEEHVGPLALACTRDWIRVSEQLDLAVDAFNQSIQNFTSEAVSTFESNVRHAVYRKIEAGIGNDDLKSVLKSAIQTEQSGLEGLLAATVEKKLQTFQGDIGNVLARFRERVQQLKQAYRPTSERGFRRDFEFDMQFDSGVKYAPLVAALVGGVMMIWNPVGWVSLALGGLTIVVSIAKALWGLVDSDFKKTQQRKATNENLDRVVDSMRDAMNSNFADLRTNIDARMADIKVEIEQSVKQTNDVNTELIQVCANLSRYSRKVAQPQNGRQSNTKKEEAMA